SVFVAADATCTYSVSTTRTSVNAVGATGSIGVTTNPGCPWTAASNAAFVSITSGASGSGSGTVNYSVASNAGGAARSATLTVAGQTITIDQVAMTAADVDGDAKSDFVVFRPSSGQWLSTTTSGQSTPAASLSWGLKGDVPVA